MIFYRKRKFLKLRYNVFSRSDCELFLCWCCAKISLCAIRSYYVALIMLLWCFASKFILFHSYLDFPIWNTFDIYIWLFQCILLYYIIVRSKSEYRILSCLKFKRNFSKISFVEVFLDTSFGYHGATHSDPNTTMHPTLDFAFVL